MSTKLAKKSAIALALLIITNKKLFIFFKLKMDCLLTQPLCQGFEIAIC